MQFFNDFNAIFMQQKFYPSFFIHRNLFFGFFFIGLSGIIGRHSCFKDYARNLNGKRPVRSRRLKPHVIRSRRFRR